MSRLQIYLSFFFVTITVLLFGQHDSQKYYPVEDPLVQTKLETWQDLKFGMLMHWGPYSQWGIVESWSICPEDYGWCQRKKPGTPGTYFEYVKAYENLQNTFNPTAFNPTKWAAAAKEAGMKYLVFTTKHHDGFSMFDSKYTDYKITSPNTPFHTHEKANIVKEVFDAFRNEGLWAGAYFSKPDWHHENYWWPYFPPKDRNVNYDPEAYPDRWNDYVEFTHNQIMELMTDYGKVDILWLDGGWVKKRDAGMIRDYYHTNVDVDNGFLKSSSVNQDIRMDELVKKARSKQPGLIVVDRAVEGPNQNYLTPENTVPDASLPFPWESCIISGGGWSYTPDAKYKSPREVIHMLVDIVCKGGNLLLNFAPGPDGSLQEEAYTLMEEIGDWMDINSESIYATRAIYPFKESKICFAQNKADNVIYATYLADEEETQLPRFLQIDAFTPTEDCQVTLLGSEEDIRWSANGSGIHLALPQQVRETAPCKHAWVFKLEGVQPAH